VEDEARKALIAKFNDLITGNGGSVEKVEEWGKRRLAYAIDYKTEGYYVLVNFQAEADLPKELERNLQISDSVIRYQVIKQIERKVGIKPRAVRPAPVAAPAAAPAVEAEPAAEAPVETPAAE
jgi:small subunit ribosomal protein S6